jgi:hypothetical protein
MEFTNEELTESNIPNRYDQNFWNSVWMEFALSFDGYAYAGGDGMTNLINLCTPITSYFSKKGKLPLKLSLSDLRGCLFLCQRFWRNSGEGDLNAETKDLIISLIEAIREKVVKRGMRRYVDENISVINKAIIFATKAHDGQYRKGTEIPYIVHPYAVAMILMKAGCNEELIVAGLLHDIIEDTTLKFEDIEREFGVKVAEIVVGCSEPDKSLSWKERKEHTLHYLKTAPEEIRLVACADKLHNVRSIRMDLETIGNIVWDRFNTGKKQQAWYYNGLIKSLGYSSRFNLLDQLHDEVELLFY